MDRYDAEKAGNKMLQDGKLDEALAHFELALQKYPDDADLLNGMGAALRGLGRYDEAQKCFERALRIDPRDRDAS